MLHTNRETIAPVPQLAEESNSKVVRSVCHLASNVIDFVLRHSEEKALPMAPPEVSRGVLRVRFGTDPVEASALAQRYGQQRTILLAAGRRRRLERIDRQNFITNPQD